MRQPRFELGTFALSFAIVAYYWLVHHLIFASLRGVKVALIWANMLFLFTIAVLPVLVHRFLMVGSLPGTFPLL